MAANISTQEASLYAAAEAWVGGEKVSWEKVAENYLITFKSYSQNSTGDWV